MTKGAIAEPVKLPFDIQIPVTVTDFKNRFNLIESKDKIQFSKTEIRAQIEHLIGHEELSIEEAAKRVGISVITVRRISRTLQLGPYREMAPTTLRSKSSQTPYGWTRVQGTLVRLEHEWTWIEEAFKLHHQGKSLHKIAAHFNALNVTSKNGGTWSAKTVSQTLKWNELHLKKTGQRR